MRKIIYLILAILLVAGVSAGVSFINWGDVEKIEELKNGTLSPNYIDENGEATGISSADLFAGIVSELIKKDAEILALQTELNSVKDCAKSSNNFLEYQICVGAL